MEDHQHRINCNEETEENLLQKMEIGGSIGVAAFECLFKRANVVSQVCSKVVKRYNGTREDAEDLINITAEKIWDSVRKGGYEHQGKFRGFAYIIAKRTAADYFKEKRKTPTVNKPFEELEGLLQVEAPDSKLEDEELEKELERFMDQFSPDCLNILLLAHKGYSDKEILPYVSSSNVKALKQTRYRCANAIRKKFPLIRKAYPQIDDYVQQIERRKK